MKLPVLKSPFAGLPDGHVQMPTKPVRLHLQPDEAMALYVALETLIDSLENVKTAPRRQDLIDLLSEVHDKLLDRMDVSFPSSD